MNNIKEKKPIGSLPKALLLLSFVILFGVGAYSLYRLLAGTDSDTADYALLEPSPTVVFVENIIPTETQIPDTYKYLPTPTPNVAASVSPVKPTPTLSASATITPTLKPSNTPTPSPTMRVLATPTVAVNKTLPDAGYSYPTILLLIAGIILLSPASFKKWRSHN